jgi:hypothetical protein
MILDQELDQLSRPESGAFGAVGFAALGAALGSLPGALSAMELLKSADAKPMPAGDLTSLLVCLFCGGLAIACLAVWGAARWRNRGLPERIRARKKHDILSLLLATGPRDEATDTDETTGGAAA